MKKHFLFSLLFVVFLLPACIIEVIPKERDCDVYFTYEYRLIEGTLKSGTFNGLTQSFRFENTPVEESILSSSCNALKEGRNVENYRVIEFNRHSSGNYLGSLTTTGSELTDNGSFLINSSNEVLISENIDGRGTDVKIGTISIDIPNKKLFITGNRTLSEKLGDD